MSVYSSDISCGVRELEDLREKPEESIAEVAIERIERGGRFVFVMFSDTIPRGNGTRIAKYIIKNGLGDIIETRVRENPNTGRRIRVWVWGINLKALTKFWNGYKHKQGNKERAEDNDFLF